MAVGTDWEQADRVGVTAWGHVATLCVWLSRSRGLSLLICERQRGKPPHRSCEEERADERFSGSS